MTAPASTDASEKAARFRMAFGKIVRDLGLSQVGISQATRQLIVKELTEVVDEGETDPLAMAAKTVARITRSAE